MLNFKTVMLIAEAIALKHRQNPAAVNVSVHDFTYRFSVQSDVILYISMFHFSLKIRSHIPNEPIARRWQYQDRYTEFTGINWLGPLSRMYRLASSIYNCHYNSKIEEERMQLLQQVNSVLDLNGLQFEQDVLKGDGQ